MTKYYAVDVRDVTDAAAWYEQMEALGFNFEDHYKKSHFSDTYWFYFNEDKNYITYLCEDDCNEYECDNDFDGACQWFIDHEDHCAHLEEFQLPSNSFYYGQL